MGIRDDARDTFCDKSQHDHEVLHDCNYHKQIVLDGAARATSLRKGKTMPSRASQVRQRRRSNHFGTCSLPGLHGEHEHLPIALHESLLTTDVRIHARARHARYTAALSRKGRE